MPELPPGIVVDRDRIRIDLRLHPALSEHDGVLALPELDLPLVRGRHKIRAFCAFCPHKPAKQRPVERIGGTDRPAFRCRHHDWTWDHRGRATGASEARLDRYDTEIVGDELIVHRR